MRKMVLFALAAGLAIVTTAPGCRHHRAPRQGRSSATVPQHEQLQMLEASPETMTPAPAPAPAPVPPPAQPVPPPGVGAPAPAPVPVSATPAPTPAPDTPPPAPTAEVKERFDKIHTGMTQTEVVAILGEPTRTSRHPTGKLFNPFYYGTDNFRTEFYYRGIGRVSFGSVRNNVVETQWDPTETGLARER